MINKVNLQSMKAQKNVNHTSKNILQTKSAETSTVSSKLAGSETVGSYQAMLGINPNVSFGKSNNMAESKKALPDTAEVLQKSPNSLTDFEKSLIGDKEIRIPNILDLKQNIDIPLKKMPQGKEHLNTAGLNVDITKNGSEETYKISNDKGDCIFEGKIDRTKMSEVPAVTYKQGKFMPEISIKDSSLEGKSVKMYAGSEIKGEGFNFRMIGSYEPAADGKKKQIPVSFKGRTVITTLNKEPRTLYAVDSYRNSGLQEKAVKGDYYDMVKADDPTVIIPAGGFGERFYNITRDEENKPSGKLPTDDRYRIIATSLNLAASAGILNGDGTDSIDYLSQAHEIDENKDVHYVSKYKTDGGAIAEGLKRDIIKNDKPGIILNADIFTNADITRTYNALKTLPHAALVIPYYPVGAERAKSFGLLGIEQDEEGNLQIKKFLEKPKYTADAPLPSDFDAHGEYDKAMAKYLEVQTAVNPNDETKFLANPGFYFLSPQAEKVLMAKGILEPSKTGLGADVMPKIVEMANNGELIDADGSEMKAYTVPLEAKGGKPAVWDDIGTAEAYLKLIKDVAREYNTHGNTENNKYYGVPEFVMSDFSKNTDLDTGIVYSDKTSKEVLENFKQKYNVKKAEGNIYIK